MRNILLNNVHIKLGKFAYNNKSFITNIGKSEGNTLVIHKFTASIILFFIKLLFNKIKVITKIHVIINKFLYKLFFINSPFYVIIIKVIIMFTKIYEKVKLFIVENYKFLLMLVAIILIFKIELPYVIYKPGGSINLNDRIEIEDGYESKGSFEMAYVSLVKGNLPFLLVAKIIPKWDIIPKDNIINDDESLKDALEKDKLYLEEAIDNATIAAYNLANKEIKITNTINNVILSLTQSNLYGNSIIENLYNQIDYLREKRKMEVKGKIAKVPVLISVISVLFFVPLLIFLATYHY